MKTDLATDIILIERQIVVYEFELAKDWTLSKRLSSPNTNTDTDTDTIKKITHYEFLPYFDLSNELNQSTFNALLASGNLGLLDKNFAKKFQE